MKTIFRFFNMAVLLAAFIAAGAVANYAQDPCTDAEGIRTLGDKFRTEFALKDPDGRRQAIETGKQFVTKYGSCESAKELSDYLKTNLPKLEESLNKILVGKAQAELTARFDAGLKTKNWDEVYAAGKEILAKYPEDFRAAELVLGSIGLDETAKSPRVTKWNDDTLKYARMSIADLEGGKTFKTFGVPPFTYKSKDDALGWMNYTIGYILAVDKNNKKEAVGYLYKATQLASDTSTNPVVYETIGLYYFDEVNRLTDEIKAMIAAQNDADTPEVKAEKVEAIKAKVALVNGTAERALDVYARAYKLAPADAKNKPYRDKLYKNLQDVFKLRYEKLDGMDAWIAAAPAKPFPNPTTPVTPVADPDPTAPAAATGTTTTAPATPKPPVTTTPLKPTDTAPAKPAATTPVGSKPQAVVKKAAARKKGA